MKRYVIVPIDNDDVTDIGVVELDMDSGTTSRGLYHLSAPPNNRLTLDLEEAIATLEMSGWPYREQVAARLRAAFGLDEGSK